MPRWAYGAILLALWVAWLIYWMARAQGVKAVQRQESGGSRLSYVIPLLVGAYLILRVRPGPGLREFYLPLDWLIPAYWIGVALIVIGLGFSVWAREYLGTNWSGSVTLKEGHELIRSGPYAWVRHPIYTGILLAIAGCALAQAEWRGLIGFVLIVDGLVRKLKIEERFLSELFGEQYTRYRKEVAALVPGVF